MKPLLLILLLALGTIDTHSQRRNRRRRLMRPAGPADATNATHPQTQNEMLLESNFRDWEQFLLYPEQGFIDYTAIYRNPKNNMYYFATMYEISNIQFSLTNAKEELLFSPDTKEPSLIYVGNIAPLKRIFANTNRNKTFVKVLSPIKDNQYMDNSRLIRNRVPPVQPILNHLFRVQYTNRAGFLYQRVLNRQGILQMLGEIPPSMRPPKPPPSKRKRRPNNQRRRPNNQQTKRPQQ